MTCAKRSITISCTPANKTELEILANQFECQWGGRPNISQLIEKIATGEIELKERTPEAMKKWQIAKLKQELKTLKTEGQS